MTLTAAGDILESAILVGLNNPPLLIPTRGEGAAAHPFQMDDYVNPTSANVLNSTYVMGPRIPTNAKIKKVSMYGVGIDSNSTLAITYDVNLIFSDAPIGGIVAGEGTNDGTTYTNAGQIPTSALTGTTTSPTAYASPNKMFGTGVVPVAVSGAYKIQELTYANSFTFADRFLPIWDVLGYSQDPGGFFDFFIVQTHAAGTAAAGTLGLIVDFVS